ncbi:TatD family hydrolase [Aliarcobacter butzleri]|uniref:TatD family hydrolase n=1 Tax=Aliarcobacter butzleri TaxID=28197 RepID=UPI00215B68CC|nr:TatD family hydrolase [Aliarcobacter butzleri]MCR8711000.1 TatD family hydrolase [Aliarcobacter butzleri]
MNLVDTHCHINFFKNAGEIALECEKTKTHTIYVTTLPSQFEETFKYVKSLKYIYPSLGFHCLESAYDLKKEKEIFLKNLDQTKYIGEVGLDFSKRAIKSENEQIALFEFILKNINVDKHILNIHSSNAEDKVFEMIVRFGIKKAIFHWYTGKIGTLNRILEHDYYFSINEAMCKSKKGQNIIAKLPRNKILIETDAPFIKEILPYENYYVYLYLSNIFKLDIKEVVNLIYNNFKNLNFNKNINTNIFSYI